MLFFIINITIIVIIVLIAYWWANQGLFSALLHLLCVIVAGALALAFWEPLTLGLLIRGKGFDDYAWGVSLIGVFVFALMALRVACDKIIPSNVDLPHWANLAFGFPVGLAAGYLTMGLTIIGIGYLPTQREFMDINGWQRKSAGQVDQIESMPFWSCAPQITTWFYDMVSDGALATNTPLQQYNPELYKQATLLRDGFTSPKGELISKVSIQPEAVQIVGLVKSTEARALAVRLKFLRAAFDGGGQQLVLSAAQIRLIGKPKGRGEPAIVYPIGFAQSASATSVGYFRFDTAAHYITSVPGQESAEVLVVFPLLPGDAEPRFVQIRGTRFPLPTIREEDKISASAFESMKFTLGQKGASELAAGDRTKPTLTREEIEVSDALPVNTSSNALPPGMTTEAMNDRQALFEGKADFRKSAERAPLKLLIDRIYHGEATSIVQLDASRLKTADVFGFVRRQNLGDSVTPMLVDGNGYTYRAIGYVHDHGDIVTIRLDRHDGIGSVRELPELPSSGAETIKLVFEVTDGVQLSAFCLNNVVVANTTLATVPKLTRPTSAAPPPETKPPATGQP